jgi:hypothetical protein
MTEPRLHLDADVSIKALTKTLLKLGHDVTRTPNSWMPLDATDEYQLLGATAHGRCILTFNIRDFTHLAQQFPEQSGILLVKQRSISLTEMIQALDCLLTETEAAEWIGQVRWLTDWLR